VNRDVRFVILLWERTDWLAIENAHVLIDWVHLNCVFWFLQDLIDVLVF
jgi:hypothetical protein